MDNVDTQILIEGLENYISLLRRDLQQARDEAERYRKQLQKKDKGSVQLCDQFAMAALTGMLANPATPLKITEKMMKTVYEVADLMIEVREANDE